MSVNCLSFGRPLFDRTGREVGVPMQHFSNVGKQAFGWVWIAAFVSWLDERIGMLLAAKLQRCAGGACGAGHRLARRGELAD
jgi:hypothetical protein